MLGVTTFLGIDYSAAAMRENGSEIYNRLNFRDIEAVSTLLFSEEDLEDIKKIDGVKDAEPQMTTRAKASTGETKENINVVSLTERINLTEIKEGVLPKNSDECVLEKVLADKMNLHVGDTIDLVDAEGNTAQYLKGKSYKIVGIVTHLDHINNIVPDTFYVIVPWESFDHEALDNCFMKIEIEIYKPKDSNRFSDSYIELVDGIIKKIDSLSFTNATRRDNQVRNTATNKITDAKEQLSSAFDQIEDGKEQIRDIIKSAFEIAFREDKEKKLVKWATKRKADVDNPSETAIYLYITENIRIDLSRPLEEVFEAILYSESIPEKLLVNLYETIKKEEAPKTGTDYDMDAVRDYLVSYAVESSGQYKELTDGCKKWDEAHSEYINGLNTYHETVEKLDPCRWISYGGNGNGSYVQLQNGSKNFSDLKSTFSLLFIIVGALVIFATIGKMVDEQRNLVGTTKALGFFTREIFAKYICFGVSATLIGTILGILVARFLVEPILLDELNEYYFFDITTPRMLYIHTLIVILAGVALALIAIWLACSKLLKEPAIRLMQPKAPSTKTKAKKGKKNFLSLYSRLIVLNMKTDLKRVIVTIASVAGCCALVVIGITLRNAMMNCVVKQYEEIVSYDIRVNYDNKTSASAGDDIETILKTSGTDYAKIGFKSVTYQINDLQLAQMYCGDIEEINKFQQINDWETGEPLKPTNNGIYIQRRIAERYGIDVGNAFDIAIEGTKIGTVRVAGVFENYIGHLIIISPEYYERVFGEKYSDNAYLVRLNGANGDVLTEQLKSVNGYESVEKSDTDRAIVERSTSFINLVVLLFIFIAAVMAGVVQLNLTNMYILQKKRELTIMRINGFTTKEVINYVLRETIVTTIVGILLGIAFGAVVSYGIERTVEQAFIQFDRSISPLAFAVGTAITILFTVIVNMIALRKVKKLKLTDV